MDDLLSFGRSLRDFQSPNQCPVFTDAETYPSFFDQHLVHPCRKIKIFINDPNANIRAFYFQYLILCFQIENPNSQFYLNKLHKLVTDPNFSFLFLQDDQEAIFNDKQFKRFLLEFLDMFEGGINQNISLAINKFPLIDLVFVYFFRSLLIYAGITDDFDSYIDRNIIFGFFMESFKIDVAVFQEKCLKFFEAQIFLYQESPEQIYLVYKQSENQVSQSQNQADSEHKHSFCSKQSGSVQQNISMLQDYGLQKSPNQKQSRNMIKSKNQNEQQKSHSFNKIGNQYETKVLNITDFDKKQSYLPTPYQSPRYPANTPNKPEIIKHPNLNARTTRATTIITPQQQTLNRNQSISNINVRSQRHTHYEINSFKYNQVLGKQKMHNDNQELVVYQNIYDSNKKYGQEIFPSLNSVVQPQIINSAIDPKKNFGKKQTDNLLRNNNALFNEKIMQKLNISKQFTDSFTLAKMGQPYKSHIRNIKSRSREYRQSLLLSFQ